MEALENGPLVRLVQRPHHDTDGRAGGEALLEREGSSIVVQLETAHLVLRRQLVRSARCVGPEAACLRLPAGRDRLEDPSPSFMHCRKGVELALERQ